MGVMPSVPRLVPPMLVSSGALPRDPVWAWKWDGFRCCLVTDGQGMLRVATRSGRLVQDCLPELARLGECGQAVVLDGELVVGGWDAAELLPTTGTAQRQPARGYDPGGAG